MILADTGVSTPLKLQLKDGAVSKGVRAKLKTPTGVVLATVNCPHVGDGTYVGFYTFVADGDYIAVFTVYTDPTYATVDVTRETTSEDYRARLASDPASVVSLVWDELLARHATPGSTGAALTELLNRDTAAEVWNALSLSYNLPDSMGEIMNALRAFDPSLIAGAVWDESVWAHQLPNTFGSYQHVIRAYARDNNILLTDGEFGLHALRHDIDTRADEIIVQINQNEVKIDAIIPAVNAADAHLTGEIGDVRSRVMSLSAQLSAAEAAIIAEIAARDARFNSLDSAVSSIQNNTTVRFVVPERLVKPASGTKTYQFHLRLFDDIGNAEAPDVTPTMRVRRLDTGADIINNDPMTSDGGKIGAYFYDYPISSGVPEYPLLVEVTVTENGSVRYIPATTEITEFEADLNQIQSQLTVLQNTTNDIDSQINSPFYGLAALKTDDTAIIAEINQNETKIDLVKLDTSRIPVHPATSEQVADAKTAILARPLLSDIEGSLNYLRDEIRGPGAYSITDVYNRWDISTLAKTNDPRFSFLDISIASRSTLTAHDVWAYGTRTLTDFDLSQANVAAIWGFFLSQATVPNSFGERIANYLDVPVSTRATQSQVSSLLAGVAQEATVAGLYGTINNLAVENELLIQELMAKVNLVKAKTDLLPSDPSSASAIASDFNALSLACANVKLELDQVKAKTDNLPIDPARQTTLLQVPTNPLLVTDPRLVNLDARISTRSTLTAADLSPLAKEATLVHAANDITHDLADLSLEVVNTGIKVDWVWGKAEHLPADPASNTRIAQAEANILAHIPPPSTCRFDAAEVADEVWAHTPRTLTDPFPDVSNLATKDDVAGTGPQYINRMSTSFNDSTGDQEMIVWMEKNGSSNSTATNCSVAIYSSGGVLQWSGASSLPNAHGVFRFVHPIAAQADANYYVVISTDVDGSPRETTQSFVTIG